MTADSIRPMNARQQSAHPVRPKRRGWFIGTFALLIGLAVAAWGGRNVYTTAQIGAAFVAKHTCSCRFVAGRSAESCSADYDPQAARLLTVNTAQSSVTVSALAGVLSTRAEFEPGFGCHLVN